MLLETRCKNRRGFKVILPAKTPPRVKPIELCIQQEGSAVLWFRRAPTEAKLEAKYQSFRSEKLQVTKRHAHVELVESDPRISTSFN